MAVRVSLAAVANQALSIVLDGSRYDLTVKACPGCVAVSIVRDGVPLVTGARAVAGTPLLPYRHLEAGNFIFVTNDDALPDWTQFETDQALIYLSAAELGAARG